jgi:hypothetical protein
MPPHRCCWRAGLPPGASARPEAGGCLVLDLALQAGGRPLAQADFPLGEVGGGRGAWLAARYRLPTHAQT